MLNKEIEFLKSLRQRFYLCISKQCRKNSAYVTGNEKAWTFMSWTKQNKNTANTVLLQLAFLKPPLFPTRLRPGFPNVVCSQSENSYPRHLAGLLSTEVETISLL